MISENDINSQGFYINTSDDAIHIVTLCDRHQVPCQPIVTHSDGSLISIQSPATVGEVVTVYAWGLGSTMPTIKTGTATPTPAPIIDKPYGVAISLRFRHNAMPSRPAGTLFTDAYLTPGEVGLYQINVQLPNVFPQVDPCDEARIQSNLTINIGSSYDTSFDGAGICVAVNQ